MNQDHINIITPQTKLEGSIEFRAFTRFEGYLKGSLKGVAGCEIVIGENAVVEGSIDVDSIIIDGFVRGNIKATNRILISQTGRVIGDLDAPNIAVKFGGFLDGQCTTRTSTGKA